MFIDMPACETFWQDYLARLPAAHPHHQKSFDCFGFGGEPKLADELATLTLSGQKCATTSLPIEYTSLDEALPQAGDLSVIVWGSGKPAAIIERSSVELIPFGEVSEAFAAIEGEGDGSLKYWQEAHIEYFTEVCRKTGSDFDFQTPVLCQVFCVIWPASSP